MRTEINGNIKGYIQRFRLPSSKCFTMPLKQVGIISLIEMILTGLFLLVGISKVTIIIILIQSLFMVSYYVTVLKDDFWNIVLEDSKGLLADLLMWIYYIALCVISLFPALVFFYLSDSVVL